MAFNRYVNVKNKVCWVHGTSGYSLYAALLFAGMFLGFIPLSAQAQARMNEMPEHCTSRQPAGEVVNGSDCIFNSSSVDCSSYESIFGPFPGGPTGVQFAQPNGAFIALEFGTENLTATGGTWDFVPPQFGSQNTGPRLVSISNCPGDFDQAKIEAEMGSGCYQKSRPALLGGDLHWFRDGTSGTGCRLEVREQPYFLNIIYTTDPEGTPPSQITWQCGKSTDTSACLSNLAPMRN